MISSRCGGRLVLGVVDALDRRTIDASRGVAKAAQGKGSRVVASFCATASPGLSDWQDAGIAKNAS